MLCGVFYWTTQKVLFTFSVTQPDMTCIQEFFTVKCALISKLKAPITQKGHCVIFSHICNTGLLSVMHWHRVIECKNHLPQLKLFYCQLWLALLLVNKWLIDVLHINKNQFVRTTFELSGCKKFILTILDLQDYYLSGKQQPSIWTKVNCLLIINLLLTTAH